MLQEPHPVSDQIVASMQRLLPSALPWSGIVYRGAWSEYAGRSTVLSGKGARLVGARYTPRGAFVTLYTSLEPETAMLEVIQRLRDYGMSIADAFPRVFYAIEVALGSVLDLTQPAIQRGLDVAQPVLVADNWHECRESDRETLTQAIGRTAWTLGLDGLMAPSARRAGGRNLVIFPDNLGPDSHLSLRRRRRE